MEEKQTRSPGTSGVSAAEESENHYELDLDEHAPEDIDEAFEDAVAAVDRSKEVDASNGQTANGREPRQTETSDRETSDRETSDRETSDLETSGLEISDRQPSGFDQSRLEKEVNGLRERLMRTLADFDNYRKRTEREKQALRRFANFDVFKDFLGVLDNFERAMDSSGSAEDLRQGLEMIVRQQEEILRRHGVKRVDAVGKAFDPSVHEAVAREESSEVEIPTVTREMQRGYLLHDRLLRPAMVFVAMPSGEATIESEDETGDASD